MATNWVLPCADVLRNAICPCLLHKDMCDHVEGNGGLGCCLSCCGAGLCVECNLAPRIAEKGGMTESCVNSMLCNVCCGPCYAGQIHMEYYKQRKLESSGQDTKSKPVWMMPCKENCKRCICPCIVAGEVCEHTGGAKAQGCLGFLCCEPCWWCYIAPKIAEKSGIKEDTMSAVMMVCFCKDCYAGQLTGEYYWQKQMGCKGAPAQYEMN